MSEWKENSRFVFRVAQKLDCTPQQVLDRSWSEIMEELGEDRLYAVIENYGRNGHGSMSIEHLTDLHIKSLRKRGKL